MDLMEIPIKPTSPDNGKFQEENIMKICDLIDAKRKELGGLSANKVVVGGLSKLIKHFTRNNENTKIMTYADRRFGEGLGYEKAGFKLVGDSGIDYWYSDGINRYDRFIIKSDGTMTEREKAAEMKLYKVWGCGSNIWVLDDI